MTDIIRQIPWQVSNFGGAGVGGSYNLQDYEFDYALGGIPFLSATHDQFPNPRHYTEGMAPIRKQQFDSFAEPGEQSLTGWWLRSQSTFTGGAGILYQDPDNDNQFNFRFSDSLGVDPWTAGDLKLLRDVQPGTTGAASTDPQRVRGFVDTTGLDAYWITDGSAFQKVLTPGAPINVIGVSADVIYSLTSTGKRYFLGRRTDLATGVDAGAATNWYTWAATNRVVCDYVKARVVVGVNNSLYTAFDPAGPAVAIGTGNSHLFYTHPNPDWTWTSISEGPSAVYAAGTDGTTGAIFKFVLTAAGDVPVLSGGIITAQMPGGEYPKTIYGYIGSFLGIATNKGFRVGEIDAQGDVQYGPLLFQPTGGCEGIVGFDRFLWIGSTNSHDGSSGLFRVDLGSTIQEQSSRAVRYAYARDIYYAGLTEPVNSVTMFGASNRKVFGITAQGSGIERATTLVPTGYLKTGRIRFNTEEPKLYKFFSIRTPTPLQGTVLVSVLDQGGGDTPYITFSPTFAPSTGDIATPQPAGPQNWVALKFTLGRGANTDFGGEMNGWQIKALPGSIRQRIITHVWLLFDQEIDQGGQRLGYDGYARQRLEDFKQLARKGDVVTFQELQDDLSTQVVIDDWTLTQLATPGPNGETLGGYLTVVMRTVAESA